MRNKLKFIKSKGVRSLCSAFSIPHRNARKDDAILLLDEFIQRQYLTNDPQTMYALRDLIIRALLDKTIPTLADYLKAQREGNLSQMLSDVNNASAVSAASNANSAKNASNGTSPAETDEYIQLFAKSHFYKPKKTIYPDSGYPILTVRSEMRRKNTTRINFKLTKAEVDMIKRLNYSVYLFCGTLDAERTKKFIYFPSPSSVECNGVVTKANTKGIPSKPGSTNPVNLSKFVKLNETNRLSIVYRESPDHIYEFYLYLVEESSIDKVAQKVLDKPRIPMEDSIKLLNGDGELQLSSESVQLFCPCSFVRIKNPVRATTCNHVQCFDLYSFLKLQQTIPAWECPVCSQNVKIKNLEVDSYFTKLLKEIDSKYDYAVVNSDGSYMPKLVATDTEYKTVSKELKDGTGKTEKRTPEIKSENVVIRHQEKEVVDLTLEEVNEPVLWTPDRLRLHNSNERSTQPTLPKIMKHMKPTQTTNVETNRQPPSQTEIIVLDSSSEDEMEGQQQSHSLLATQRAAELASLPKRDHTLATPKSVHRAATPPKVPHPSRVWQATPQMPSNNAAQFDHALQPRSASQIPQAETSASSRVLGQANVRDLQRTTSYEGSNAQNNPVQRRTTKELSIASLTAVTQPPAAHKRIMTESSPEALGTPRSHARIQPVLMEDKSARGTHPNTQRNNPPLARSVTSSGSQLSTNIAAANVSAPGGLAVDQSAQVGDTREDINMDSSCFNVPTNLPTSAPSSLNLASNARPASFFPPPRTAQLHETGKQNCATTEPINQSSNGNVRNPFSLEEGNCAWLIEQLSAKQRNTVQTIQKLSNQMSENFTAIDHSIKEYQRQNITVPELLLAGQKNSFDSLTEMMAIEHTHQIHTIRVLCASVTKRCLLLSEFLKTVTKSINLYGSFNDKYQYFWQLQNRKCYNFTLLFAVKCILKELENIMAIDFKQIDVQAKKLENVFNHVSQEFSFTNQRVSAVFKFGLLKLLNSVPHSNFSTIMLSREELEHINIIEKEVRGFDAAYSSENLLTFEHFTKLKDIYVKMNSRKMRELSQCEQSIPKKRYVQMRLLEWITSKLETENLVYIDLETTVRVSEESLRTEMVQLIQNFDRDFAASEFSTYQEVPQRTSPNTSSRYTCNEEVNKDCLPNKTSCGIQSNRISPNQSKEIFAKQLQIKQAVEAAKNIEILGQLRPGNEGNTSVQRIVTESQTAKHGQEGNVAAEKQKYNEVERYRVQAEEEQIRREAEVKRQMENRRKEAEANAEQLKRGLENTLMMKQRQAFEAEKIRKEAEAEVPMQEAKAQKLLEELEAEKRLQETMALKRKEALLTERRRHEALTKQLAQEELAEARRRDLEEQKVREKELEVMAIDSPDAAKRAAEVQKRISKAREEALERSRLLTEAKIRAAQDARDARREEARRQQDALIRQKLQNEYEARKAAVLKARSDYDEAAKAEAMAKAEVEAAERAVQEAGFRSQVGREVHEQANGAKAQNGEKDATREFDTQKTKNDKGQAKSNVMLGRNVTERYEAEAKTQNNQSKTATEAMAMVEASARVKVAEAKAQREAVEAKTRNEADARSKEVAEANDEQNARVAAEAKARRETEERSRQEAEARAKATREAKHAEEVRLAAAIKAKQEAKAKQDAAEAKAKQEAEEARLAAEAKAKQDAEKARLAAEAKAKQEAEEAKAKQEAEKARLAAEERAKQEAKAKQDAEEAKARQAAAAKAKQEAEEAKAKQEAEKARLAAEERAKQEAKAKQDAEEAKARQAAAAKAKQEVEKARLAAEAKAKHEAEETKARQAAAEAKAKQEAAAAKANQDAAEAKAKQEAEKARLAAEAKAKQDAEEAKARQAAAEKKEQEAKEYERLVRIEKEKLVREAEDRKRRIIADYEMKKALKKSKRTHSNESLSRPLTNSVASGDSKEKALEKREEEQRSKSRDEPKRKHKNHKSKSPTKDVGTMGAKPSKAANMDTGKRMEQLWKLVEEGKQRKAQREREKDKEGAVAERSLKMEPTGSFAKRVQNYRQSYLKAVDKTKAPAREQDLRRSIEELSRAKIESDLAGRSNDVRKRRCNTQDDSGKSKRSKM